MKKSNDKFYLRKIKQPGFPKCNTKVKEWLLKATPI